MIQRDALYAQLLSLGFIVLRQAVESNDQQWIDAELEMLHNVPSLIGEENLKRHRCYWFGEREHYRDWVGTFATAEAQSRMRTYYEPIWRKMEPLVAGLLEAK